MKTIVVKIIDELGLHARPASRITAEASKYKSNITITLNGKNANAKSLINLMSLSVKKNNKIKITAKGLDEAEAIAGLEKALIDNKLV